VAVTSNLRSIVLTQDQLMSVKGFHWRGPRQTPKMQSIYSSNNLLWTRSSVEVKSSCKSTAFSNVNCHQKRIETKSPVSYVLICKRSMIHTYSSPP